MDGDFPKGINLAYSALNGLQVEVMRLRTPRFLLAVAMSLLAGSTAAVTIVDGTTSGYYTSGIGDLSVPLPYPANPFPGPNVSQGDPTLNNIPEPNVAGIANLGTWLTNAAPTGGTWSASPVAV